MLCSSEVFNEIAAPQTLHLSPQRAHLLLRRQRMLMREASKDQRGSYDTATRCYKPFRTMSVCSSSASRLLLA